MAAVAVATACVACGDDGGGSSTEAGSTGAATASGGSTGGGGESTGGSTGGSAESSDLPTSSGASTSGEATGGGSSGGTTAVGPTDGPGVLPGETGLDAFCRRYVECGGTFYADKQACIDASLDYWGSCASRRMALDAFGACMSEMACTDWSPDAYNPGSTPCAQQWQDLGQSMACN